MRPQKPSLVFYVWSLLIILFLIFSNMKMLQKRISIEREVLKAREEVERLEKKKRELEESIEKGVKESFWEEKAREKGYIKEGEESIIIQF